MKRPAWAAAGSFSDAWSWCEQQDQFRRASSLDDSLRGVALGGLAKARVLSVDSDQAEAIPIMSDDDTALVAEGLRLPFPHMYVSTGRLPLHKYAGFGSVSLRGYLAVENAILAKDLEELSRNRADTGVMVMPFIAVAGDGWVRTVLAGCACHDTAHGKPAVALSSPVGQAIGLVERGDKRWGADHWLPIVGFAARRAYALLSWLESYNVELVEAPLSPKQRTREVGKGRQIALTVQVRAPRKSVGRNGTANYSHRFEVRGHYMHFSHGPVFDATPPEKMSFVPGLGFCRKVWCPPHVKGPQDKPLIPKVRVAAHDAR